MTQLVTAAPEQAEQTMDAQTRAWLDELMPYADNRGGVDARRVEVVMLDICGTKDAPNMVCGTTYPEHFKNEQRVVIFFGEVPFESGHLVMAMEPEDGEIAPDLFYVENGAVQARTYGADCWGIDVVRFMGKTVVFGETFLFDGFSTEIVAEFFDGQRVSSPFPTGTQGYLLIADGAPDLKSLSIYNGETVEESQEYYLFNLGCANYAWAGKPQNIFYVTHLDPMYARQPDWQSEETVTLDGGADGLYDPEFYRFPKTENWVLTDAWRNGNAIYCTKSVSSGTKLTLKNLPTDVERVYLIQPVLDDATPEGAANAVLDVDLIDGTVTLPDLTGQTEVRLAVETVSNVYVITLNVQ